MSVNHDKLQEFLVKAVGDIGAAMSANMVWLGDSLGLSKAMAKMGPITSAELAKTTKTAERYIREWLGNQATGGYVIFDAETERYTIPEGRAMALADESSPCFLPGAFRVIAATFSANPKIEQRFKTGKGLEWNQHDHRLFEGTERFFRPNYAGNFVTKWIPALDGLESNLKKGSSSQTSAAATASRRFCWLRPIPTPRSSGLITTRLPSLLCGSEALKSRPRSRLRSKKLGVSFPRSWPSLLFLKVVSTVRPCCLPGR